jgi:Leucine-rich repeat (LRR) protein
MLRLDNSLLSGFSAFFLTVSFGIQAQVGICDDLIPDKNLETVVRREVFDKRYNTEPLTAEDVKNISQVVGKGKGIKSLEGLQHCKSLMKIDLEKNEIVDLAPIKELKLLQSIDLSSNKIETLEPIAALVQSQYLQLSKNAISDLSPLRQMSNLRSLYIADNKIKSLEPVSGLKKMWTLEVSGNPIEDPAPIAQLKGLESISLMGCGIKNVEFVRTLTPNFLRLNGNAITDLSPLVEACEADAKSERRFAPFLRLYLDDAMLKEASQSTAIERLKTAGVRINPSNK